MEVLFGAARLSKLADIVSEPVITGFLNALGIFILKSQLKIFQYTKGVWLPQEKLISSLAISGLCATIILNFNKINKTNVKVPPQLVGIVTTTTLATLMSLPIKTLAEYAGKADFVGGLSALPKFTGIPNIPWNFATFKLLFITALGSFSLRICSRCDPSNASFSIFIYLMYIGVAVVSIMETLLAERISCNSYRCLVPDHEVDRPDRSIIGLGVGNFMSALFGGYGGCGLVRYRLNAYTILLLFNGLIEYDECTCTY